jgi:transcription antitermination factor NusG
MLAPNEAKSALILEIERRALKIAADIENRNGDYFFEYREGVKPLWHVVGVQPGNETKAYEQLADRRCGVFSPVFAPDAVLQIPVRDGNGRLLRIDKVSLGNKLIFPGRLFIFVWDVKHHWRRIKACPDVTRIMVDGKENPVVIADVEIDKMQALQFRLAPVPKGKRKRYKAADDDKMTISPKVYWFADGTERTSSLDRVLDAH